MRPSITRPPPTPVPRVNITRWRAGGSETNCASASAAQLPSLSDTTGTPESIAQLPAQVDSLERDVHARDHPTGGELDLRREADPDRDRPPDRALISSIAASSAAIRSRALVTGVGCSTAATTSRPTT